MYIDFTGASSSEKYKLMSNCVTPRPIAWIVTENEGVINIAPFSYFTPLSSNPPIVVVSIGHKEDGTPKDTLTNILKTKKATICLATEEFASQITLSANSLPKEISEAQQYAIATKILKKGYPPIIDGVKMAFFTDFYDTFKLGDSSTIPTFLQINEAFIDDAIVDKDGHIKAENLGRIGKMYGTRFELIQP